MIDFALLNLIPLILETNFFEKSHYAAVKVRIFNYKIDFIIEEYFLSM